MAMIRHANVAKEGFASLIGMLMAQGVASAESNILSLDRFPDSSESYAGIYDLPCPLLLKYGVRDEAFIKIPILLVFLSVLFAATLVT